MNVSYEYLLKSRQLTWENTEVIDNFFGPVPLEMKKEDWKEEYEAPYKNTSADGCINDSLAEQRVSQRAYEETKKKMYVHLDYNNIINVRVLIPPLDLNVNIKPQSRQEKISFSKSDPLAVANPSEHSQGGDRNACVICHKQFTWKGDLTRHLRTHTGDKPFSCPQCGKTFTCSTSLKMHLRAHSGVKEYSCDICRKEFSRKYNLTVHRRTHTGDKSFNCSECNAMFSQRSHLKRHKRTHTGEAPYQCEICDRKFTQSDSLKTHLLIHSEEKPFACTYANCDKTFRTKGNLQIHVRVHTKDKPYACSKCKKKFSQSSSCRTHGKKCSVTKKVSSVIR